jgi:type IV secretion system protein VirB3
MIRPEGYEISFHSSLCEQINIAGVPRTIAILNGTMAAILCLGLQIPLLGAPLALAIHSAAYALNKSDPYVFPALARHIAHKSFFEA